ncbi:hypothetical protein AVEN_59716-1 [Araneus ventricosus]|uniref:Uncharacterized protein n=1 Tax=Araneus ventricosus TaxID=182803 RepID=A0A4Y2BPK2_ARAVE|nr:hypothetical protein AVEN_59716-1 [Araneus ventricosus]
MACRQLYGHKKAERMRCNADQEGVKGRWSSTVRDFLNRDLPHRWIRRADLDDVPLLPWPPRLPDLTPCDFFLWGYVKEKVYVPTMPTTPQEFITAAVMDIDRNMLLNIWTELDYRWNV